ncbi:hypothetical protein [Candidatus Leptofilum sp.]|uniref:hypothetical protein n=1 Tax=Candidatus Leptofilum sp. TaxID=3241576 RepID=UPI003B58B9EF
MSNSQLLVLATIVTIGGLVVVVLATQQILRLPLWRARLLAGLLLLLYAAVLILRPSAWSVINLAVLAGAIGGAVLLGGSLGSVGAVAAFIVTAAVVDLVSVSGRLSRVIIDGYQQGNNDLLLYLTLVVPIDGRIVPIVGISDLFIGGSTIIALIKLGLKPVVVIGTISLGLVAALIYGIWQGTAPALPFIAVAVVLLAWRHPAGVSKL